MPGRNCPLCPRLVTLRSEARASEPDWFNAPVPTFGDPAARVLVIGLAPGLRGANRTGRPFTGDYAGDLLYATLSEFGFAAGTYDRRIDDGLRLIDCAVTNAVRCVPPENKPLPVEIKTCRSFLSATLVAFERVDVLVALGRIAHETVIRAHGEALARYPFKHGAHHDLERRPNGGRIALFDSYHCSRYNTNTGVLTVDMFRAVFAAVRDHIDGAALSRAP